MKANSIKPETHTKAHYSNTVKGQKRILKATRAKWLVMYKGSSMRSTADFLSSHDGGQNAVGRHIQIAKGTAN